MAGIVYDLLEILEHQKECYEGLLTLANYKTESVKNKELELLTQIVEKEEEFIGRVNLLDKKRESMLKDIALVTGLKYEEITLTRLVDKMGKDLEISEALLKVRGEILELMEGLRAQNEINKMIIEESLEYVNFTINAIKSTKMTQIPVNYGRPGEEETLQTRSLFDKRQ